MSEDLRRAPEDLEPEARRSGSAPAKKPLAEFLAEFEARLRDHPDEPATGAVQVVEDRAAGFRRGPAQVIPAPPASSAGLPALAPPPQAEAIVEMPASLEVPLVDEHVDELGDDPPAIETAEAELAPSPAAESGIADGAGESRRLRGRRRRKHRHRAH
jgi:hypothetical protein